MIVVHFNSGDRVFLEQSGWRTWFVSDGYAFMVRE
jgi:hypothetical protein